MYKLMGEFLEHKAVIFLLPYRDDIWRKKAVPSQKMIVDLANMVAEKEHVILGVHPDYIESFRRRHKMHENVTVVEMKYNDSWPRDSISDVVYDENNKPILYSYHFNAYGGSLYAPYDDDENLDKEIAKLFNLEMKQSPLTLEGGNMVGDGNGTLFVVEDSIVNDNRNPGMDKKEIEELLKESTGSKQIVFIKRGLDFDETGGHIDNILAFANEKTMLLSWTDDVENEHYKRVREIENQIKEVRNINGEEYNIIHLPIPRITYRKREDSQGIKTVKTSFARLIGDPVLNTYVNIIIANGLIILPEYGIPSDKEALEIVKRAFPTREVKQYNAKEASLGGGGFHCLSKHIS